MSDQKVYMPLMIGDWLKGTRLMRADVRGVYIELLLYQWDNGFIPSEIESLEMIDRDLGKVWDKLKDKFQEVAPGQLQNKKLEEVRCFWNKQKNNGLKGGRPKRDNPNETQMKPNDNPNNNLHIDIDLDTDIVIEDSKGVQGERKKQTQRNTAEDLTKIEILELIFTDERFIQELTMVHPDKDFRKAFEECYLYFSNRPNPPNTLWQWREKLLTWISNTKIKTTNGQSTAKDKSAEHLSGLVQGYKRRHNRTS